MATAKYPGSLAVAADFFGQIPGIPNSTATLSGAHTDAVTTITLAATVPSSWPTTGAVTIDNEIVKYTGKSGATLTGCTRGTQDTTAAAHSDGATVRFGISKEIINQLIVDLVAIEAQLDKNFVKEHDAGNSGAALTVDWGNGDTQKVTMTGNCTFTFSNGKAGHWYALRLVQDGTGSRTATWPAAVKWPGGTAPTLTTTASREDVLLFYCVDGTNYRGATGGLNYTP